MFKCPICGSNSRVIQSRWTKDSAIRIRSCNKCFKSFYTEEILVHDDVGIKQLRVYYDRINKRRKEKQGGTKT